MAIMIPRKPTDFTPASLEDVMFDALRSLPDEYYVFHSFQVAQAELHEDGTRTVREADFLVFHPNKGIICIEAKAGKVRCQDGDWLYASGKEMKYGGPFRQAKSFKFSLMDSVRKKKGDLYVKKCKFYHAVWFPGLSDVELQTMTLPADAPKEIIMTKSSLKDPLPAIERIFEYNLCQGANMGLSKLEVRELIVKYLCPEFNIVPVAGFDTELKKLAFSRLLKEQANILNFLVDQRSAVINGAAGTGKTMIALAKAQMHARQGESVLFLCYNSKLRDHLVQNYKEENIYFYTIDGLACKLCSTATADYGKLLQKLEEMDFSDSFPFMHVVIDEGQDFGRLEETGGNIKKRDAQVGIVQELHDIVMGRENEAGTFYIFYDKLQLVQSDRIPQYIEEADCKMTLYRNCRNTENIAKTSLKPISSRKPKLMDGCVLGELATVHFCEPGNSIRGIDTVLDELKREKMDNVVILTAKTLAKSSISDRIHDEKYRNCLVATCRTFKGLEADAIVMIDVDTSTFEDGNEMLFYVGTSRARIRLDIITEMNDDECRYVLRNDFGVETKIKNPRKSFSSALNALADIVE